jgi:hypothetical protein
MEDTTEWRRHLEHEESEWFDQLFDADQQQAVKKLIELPDLGELRTRDLFALVARADVLPRLLTWFSPVEADPTFGWQDHLERSGAVGEASAAVEWTFTGSYESTRLRARPEGVDVVENDSAFNGVRPLGQRVELHGVTLLSIEGGKLRIRRYIDWVGLYAQLGLSVNWRVRQGAGRSDSS